MRVIAGKARRTQLQTVEGLGTRPTTDRIKETLFNMLAADVADASFLDLFAGSGGIGIEALSRGGSTAVFVEKNPKACECIRQNLKKTHLEPLSEVMCTDVFTALGRMEGLRSFDIIFMDPPYNHEWEKRILEYLSTSKLCRSDTLIIFEASIETDTSYINCMPFEITKEKVYKTNKHIFLHKKMEDA